MQGPDISLHQAFSSNATVSIALGGSNLFFWSREVQGPTKRLYSKKVRSLWQHSLKFINLDPAGENDDSIGSK